MTMHKSNSKDMTLEKDKELIKEEIQKIKKKFFKSI